MFFFPLGKYWVLEFISEFVGSSCVDKLKLCFSFFFFALLFPALVKEKKYKKQRKIAWGCPSWTELPNYENNISPFQSSPVTKLRNRCTDFGSKSYTDWKQKKIFAVAWVALHSLLQFFFFKFWLQSSAKLRQFCTYFISPPFLPRSLNAKSSQNHREPYSEKYFLDPLPFGQGTEEINFYIWLFFWWHGFFHFLMSFFSLEQTKPKKKAN